MADLGDAKNVYGTFSNDEEWVKVTYDFSVDGGATGDYTVFTAKDKLVITDFYAHVETALTSGTDFDIDLGVGAGGTEIWSDKAKAGFAINTVVGMDTFAPVYVASAGTIVLGIETAAATAGKMHMFFKVKKITD